MVLGAFSELQDPSSREESVTSITNLLKGLLDSISSHLDLVSHDSVLQTLLDGQLGKYVYMGVSINGGTHGYPKMDGSNMFKRENPPKKKWMILGVHVRGHLRMCMCCPLGSTTQVGLFPGVPFFEQPPYTSIACVCMYKYIHILAYLCTRIAFSIVVYIS